MMSTDIVNDPCAISFGLNGTEGHIWEYSWLGFAHFMRLNGGGLSWTQTATIDPASGRWQFFEGLLVSGTCFATKFSSSDSRLKTNLKEIPEEDAINLLKNVSPKTYNRINMQNNKKRNRFYCSRF